MAEVTNELMLEILRALPARLAQVDGKVDELKQEMQAFRIQLIGIHHETLGVHQEISGIHSTLVRHEQRLERIDRRLGLVEAST